MQCEVLAMWCDWDICYGMFESVCLRKSLSNIPHSSLSVAGVTLSQILLTPRLSVLFCFTAQIWPVERFPLHPVGKMVLDRNIDNFFSENETIAFAPSTIVPGEWGFVYSADHLWMQGIVLCKVSL